MVITLFFSTVVNFTDEEPPFSGNTVIKLLLLLFVSCLHLEAKWFFALHLPLSFPNAGHDSRFAQCW